MISKFRSAVASAVLLMGTASFTTLAAAQEAPATEAPAAAPAPASGTATPPAAETPAPAAPPEAPLKPAKPAKPAKGASVTVVAPAEGKGQVVFFRPSKFVGMAVGFKVREGTTELCTLNNGAYCILQVEPGAHVYVVHSEVKDELTIEVEVGETYYVQGNLGMGVMVGRPNLSPSDQATFDGMSGKLKLDPKAGAYPAKP